MQKPSFAFPLICQISEPSGFWVTACGPMAVHRRFCRVYSDCSPPDVNDSAPSSATPAGSGPGVCIPVSVA